jgi:hypothetical protein
MIQTLPPKRKDSLMTLTRELGKESTFRNGEFSNERDPIPLSLEKKSR